MVTSSRPDLSIIFQTYNHAEFVAQALDGIFMQQTTYTYEVIVVDDCSKDRTQEIILEYKKKYPDKIRTYFNSKNVGTLDPPIQKVFAAHFHLARGKYLTCLEGDDYWTSPNKIQRQLDFLEANPSYVGVAHNAIKIFQDKSRPPERFNYYKESVKAHYTIYDFAFMNALFHTTAVTYRNVLNSVPDKHFKEKWSCDMYINLVHIQYGPLRHFDEDMSVYRIHKGGSYSNMSNLESKTHALNAVRSYNRWLGYRYLREFSHSAARIARSILDDEVTGAVPPLKTGHRFRLKLLNFVYQSIYDLLVWSEHHFGFPKGQNSQDRFDRVLVNRLLASERGFDSKSATFKRKLIAKIKGLRSFLKNANGWGFWKGIYYLFFPAQKYRKGIRDLRGIEFLYDLLSDEESKDLLLQIFVFRLRGGGGVRLPRNNPEHWAGIERARGLQNSSPGMSVESTNEKLGQFDLNQAGIPIRVHSTPFGVASIFFQREYEYDRNGVKMRAESGDIILDVGIGWGETSVYFSNIVGDSGRVYLFEANPDCLKVLRQNLSLNPQLSQRVEVVGGFSPSIDEFVRTRSVPRVDFIKIKLGGAELDVLKGLEYTIRQFRPKLAISLSHSFVDFKTIPRFLESLALGYKFYLEHHSDSENETILYAIPPELGSIKPAKELERKSLFVSEQGSSMQ